MGLVRGEQLLQDSESSKYLRQHRGQHSPSGTVALEQGMRGQDTFRHIVAEFYNEL